MALKFWECAKAIEEGKQLEFFGAGKSWKDSDNEIDSVSLLFKNGVEYRIKKENKKGQVYISMNRDFVVHFNNNTEGTHLIEFELNEEGEPIIETCKMKKKC